MSIKGKYQYKNYIGIETSSNDSGITLLKQNCSFPLLSRDILFGKKYYYYYSVYSVQPVEM